MMSGLTDELWTLERLFDEVNDKACRDDRSRRTERLIAAMGRKYQRQNEKLSSDPLYTSTPCFKMSRPIKQSMFCPMSGIIKNTPS